MTAKPIPTKAPGMLVLEDALDGLSNLAQGYMSREQIMYKRRIEEREYGFRREQFDTSKDQWQSSFNENMRQFDQQMSATQQRHEEGLVHDRAMQDERIAAQAEIQRQARGVQYHEIKVRDRQAVERLEADYKKSGSQLDDLRLMGENPSYQIVNGQFPINDVDWSTQLYNWANQTSQPGDPLLFSEHMTPELAKAFQQQILEGGDVATIVNRMEKSGLLAEPLQDNDVELEALRSIAMRANDGGREDLWDQRSLEEQQLLIDEQAKNVKMVPELEKKVNDDKLAFLRARAEMEGGGDPYGPVDLATTDAYAASGVYVRRVQTEGGHYPTLNLSTFTPGNREIAKNAEDMMIDATSSIGLLEQQWAEEDDRVAQGQLKAISATPSAFREKRRQQYKSQINAQLGVLQGISNMDREQLDGLRDYYQGISMGGSPVFPYRPIDSQAGARAGQASGGVIAKIHSISERDKVSETHEQATNFGEIIEGYEFKEGDNSQARHKRWILQASPIGEIIIAGAEGTRLTPDDINRLAVRRDELLIAGDTENYTNAGNELRFIERILTRAGIPLPEAP